MKSPHESSTSVTVTTQEVRFAPSLGRIVAASTPGEIWVNVAGVEPQRARLLAGLNSIELSKSPNVGREVLVVFVDGDVHKPVVVGVIEEPLESLVELTTTSSKQVAKLEAQVDGKRVTIAAEEEIELKCGEGSITIRKDGKIVIRGTSLLSRSSGANRVRGASVSLN